MKGKQNNPWYVLHSSFHHAFNSYTISQALLLSSSVSTCLFNLKNQDCHKRAIKSKDTELLSAKSAYYKSKRDLKYANTNLKADILTIKKETETLNSNHHFSISSAVKTAIYCAWK